MKLAGGGEPQRVNHQEIRDSLVNRCIRKVVNVSEDFWSAVKQLRAVEHRSRSPLSKLSQSASETCPGL